MRVSKEGADYVVPCLLLLRKPQLSFVPSPLCALLVIDSIAVNNRKTDTKSIIGTEGGARALSVMDEKVSAIAIGGINPSNVQ